jgi:hypothetical protein
MSGIGSYVTFPVKRGVDFKREISERAVDLNENPQVREAHV